MDVDSPQFLANPYPFYAQKRAQEPVFKRSEFEWTLTSYDALSTVLASPLAGRGNIGQTPQLDEDEHKLQALRQDNLALQIIERWMLFQNPPKHTATRARIADVFTLKIVNQLEQSMRATLRNMLLKLVARDGNEFDFVRDIAYPYPLAVVCDLIGIPEKDRGRFFIWTRNFSLAVQLDFNRAPTEIKHKLEQTSRHIEAYFSELIPNKIKAQEDDLITRFINENQHDLDAQELLANCIFLLFAGQDTTTSLLSNAIMAFVENPTQYALLRQHPELAKNAVEECLRYDPSIQMVGRYALEDIDIGDYQFQKGQHIFAFLGAAGRDPAANPEPDQFNIERQNIKHLAFARGTHHCLGASLARLEIRILLEELVSHFNCIELAGEAVRRPTWLMRGYDSIPLRYHHA